jgi:hypothetical protein
MARSTLLPERLRYLQPVRNKLAKLAPEDINEDLDNSFLRKSIRKRVHGLSEADARMTLNEDSTVLATWLAGAGTDNDYMGFVQGFLLIAAEMPEKFLKAPAPAAPLLRVLMDLPAGAKVRRFEKQGDGGMLVSRKGLYIAVGVMPEENVASMVREMAQVERGCKVAVSKVQFGKGVNYMLAVPGGHVTASISAIGKKIDESKWDESEVEGYFHTIQIVQKPRTRK